MVNATGMTQSNYRARPGCETTDLNDEREAPNSVGVIPTGPKFRCYREITFGRLKIS